MADLIPTMPYFILSERTIAMNDRYSSDSTDVFLHLLHEFGSKIDKSYFICLEIRQGGILAGERRLVQDSSSRMS